MYTHIHTYTSISLYIYIYTYIYTCIYCFRGDRVQAPAARDGRAAYLSIYLYLSLSLSLYISIYLSIYLSNDLYLSIQIYTASSRHAARTGRGRDVADAVVGDVQDLCQVVMLMLLIVVCLGLFAWYVLLRLVIIRFSSIILILRGGTLMSIGNFPEFLSQQILVGIVLVGRLGVHVYVMFVAC